MCCRCPVADPRGLLAAFDNNGSHCQRIGPGRDFRNDTTVACGPGEHGINDQREHG